MFSVFKERRRSASIKAEREREREREREGHSTLSPRRLLRREGGGWRLERGRSDNTVEIAGPSERLASQNAGGGRGRGSVASIR